MEVTVKSPETEEVFRDSLKLRYKVLREPLGQPRGSEEDSLDLVAIHAVALNPEGKVVGTGRIHSNSGRQAQIRLMAVEPELQGKGIGKQLLDFLEGKGKQMGAKYVRVHARESAKAFYAANGYNDVSEGKTLFDTVKHTWMRKEIA
ncbi:MAG: GNAT family N-acetyltransferase [Bacteroidota bacterium]